MGISESNKSDFLRYDKEILKKPFVYKDALLGSEAGGSIAEYDDDYVFSK